ncbi:MAG TPA: hypothetical protein VLA83_01850 [Candidatus Binatia bacterium]|nr:hypothetical protein [Candidatus Binatia bacterium]
MDDHGHQPESALFKPPVGAAITAVIGLIVAVLSLSVFVFDLLVTPEIGALITSFVVWGMGLTLGFLMLRRLARRREPLSLFAGSSSLPAGLTPRPEARAHLEQLSRDCSQGATAMPGATNKEDSRPNNTRHKSVSSYTARESSGAMSLILAVGVALILGGRLSGGWEFLVISLTAGFMVALALYWIHLKQNSGLDAHKIPVAGGVVGLICMTGLGIVMIRSHLLRDFFALAVGAGSVIALVLSWSHRRKENSSGSFL